MIETYATSILAALAATMIAQLFRPRPRPKRPAGYGGKLGDQPDRLTKAEATEARRTAIDVQALR